MNEVDIRQLISDVIDYAIEAVRQQYSAQLREREWWATYRAALTGMHAYSDDEGARSVDGCHGRAVSAANMAHGTLEKKP